MNKVDSCLSRSLASLFLILFVIATATALLLINIDRAIADPNVVKNILANQNIARSIPVLVADQIAFHKEACQQNPEQCEGENQSPADKEGGAVDYLKILPKQQLEILLTSLMTPEWGQAQIEGLVDQLWAYMQSSQPVLRLNLSLADPKNRLKGTEGQQAILQIILNQPACSDAQLAVIEQMAINQGKAAEEIPLCQPPQQFMSQLSPVIGSIVNPLANTLPDQIDMAGSDQAPYARLRQDYRRFHQAAFLSPFISLGLLLLVTIVAVRSLRSLFRWWGISFLLAGLLGLFAAITSGSLLSGYVNSFPAGDLAPAVQQAMQAVIASIFNLASRQTIVMAGGLVVLGLLMTGVGLLLPGKN
ncbi:MAG: hypothetical protein ACM3PY_16035 [Omnitrophica WOR_2 bacterium]